MDEIRLLMTFETSSGDKTTININGVRPDITKTEVDLLANQIIDKTILTYKKAVFTKYLGAEVETIHKEAL